MLLFMKILKGGELWVFKHAGFMLGLDIFLDEVGCEEFSEFGCIFVLLLFESLDVEESAVQQKLEELFPVFEAFVILLKAEAVEFQDFWDWFADQKLKLDVVFMADRKEPPIWDLHFLRRQEYT